MFPLYKLQSPSKRGFENGDLAASIRRALTSEMTTLPGIFFTTRLFVRPLLITNRNICLEKCCFGALTLFYARTESWAGFDALECFALLIEAVSGHFPVSRWPQFLFWPNKDFCPRKLESGQRQRMWRSSYNKQKFLPGNVLFWSFDIVLRLNR